MRKLFSVVTSLAFLANSLLYPFSIVYAEGVTPTPEPTIVAEETVIPSPEPTATPELTPSATPEITLTPEPTTEPSITPTAIPEPTPTQSPSPWTFENVELGKEYVAPQNSEVKLTFTKLPSPAGNLKIEEITLTQEQIKQTGSLSNKAYDITSDMTDGTFAYNLSLPIPEESKGKAVEVKFAEELSNIGSAEKVDNSLTKTDTSVSVTDLNHFTIFVVAGGLNPSCTDVNGVIVGGITITGSDQCYSTIQAAINAAALLDGTLTINVAAGEYVIAENILVGKALTILGANATINPNTGTRGTETVLRGNTATGLSKMLEIDAENVVIKGLTFDNLRIDNYNNTSGTNTNLIGGIEIKNNIFTNVVGTAVYLRDSRNAPGSYSNNVSVVNNEINATGSVITNPTDYGAGSGMIIMGAENSTISGNVISNSAYNGIQLSRIKTMTISGNTVTGTTQPALQIATWNEGTNTISNNTFSTTSTVRGAIRLYGFTQNYYPVFNFTNNTIQDSKYAIQIGNGASGQTINDISEANYDFTGNTFTNITNHKLVVYLNSAATAEDITEMDTLFAQVYGDGSKSRVITSVDPFKYVVNTLYVGSGKDFSTIQAAINAAMAGDTINVAAGIYTENLTVDKSLTIVGAGDTTIINGAIVSGGSTVVI